MSSLFDFDFGSLSFETGMNSTSILNVRPGIFIFIKTTKFK